MSPARQLLLLLLLPLWGCQANPACQRQIALMRSELIALEDKYYALESKYQSEVGDNCPPTALDHQFLPAPRGPQGNLPSTVHPSDEDLRIPLDPRDSSRAKPEAGPIAVDIHPDPELSVVTFQTPPQFRDATPTQSVVQAAHTDPSAADSARRGLRIAAPDRVRVRNLDASPEPDVLECEIELPTEYLQSDGVLSVAVIDPLESGERQRIGLWHFTADQIRDRAVQGTQPAMSLIGMELEWNLNQPRHPDLTLFVRWQVSDSAPEEVSQSVRADSAEPNAGEPDSTRSTGVAELSSDSDQVPQWKPDRR